MFTTERLYSLRDVEGREVLGYAPPKCFDLERSLLFIEIISEGDSPAEVVIALPSIGEIQFTTVDRLLIHDRTKDEECE